MVRLPKGAVSPVSSITKIKFSTMCMFIVLKYLFPRIVMASLIDGCYREQSRVVVPVFPRKEWDKYHGTLGDRHITFPDSINQYIFKAPVQYYF